MRKFFNFHAVVHCHTNTSFLKLSEKLAIKKTAYTYTSIANAKSVNYIVLTGIN